jgi:AraC-like DNA-binding protein
MDPDPHAGALVISSDPIRIREHARTVLGSEISIEPDPHTINSPRAVERACRQIWTVTSTLPANTPATVIASLAHALDDMLMSALVLAWSPTRHVPTPRGRTAHILDWIRCNHGISVTVSDIARAVGLSVRQLQQSVHDELGMTPMRLLRDVRLMDAHHRLRAANHQTATVAAIAHESGFAHLGRFSVMYRERFGESPSVTLMRDSAS